MLPKESVLPKPPPLDFAVNKQNPASELTVKFEHNGNRTVFVANDSDSFGFIAVVVNGETVGARAVDRGNVSVPLLGIVESDDGIITVQNRTPYPVSVVTTNRGNGQVETMTIPQSVLTEGDRPGHEVEFPTLWINPSRISAVELTIRRPNSPVIGPL